jgi:signal transduction histidine kinase/FixJ family two-component response regulator
MVTRPSWFSVPVRIPRDPTVLIIDDEAVSTKAYADLLAGAGFQAETAASTHEAVEIARSVEVDVVVLDLVMPETDPLTPLEDLRRIFPGIPVIMIGSTTLARVPEAFRKGAHDYLPKGGNPLDLIQSVSRAVQDRARMAEREKAHLDLQERVAQLTLVNELSGLLGSTRDPQQLLDLILKRVQEILDCEASSLLLRDEKTGELYFLVARGAQAAQVRSLRLRRGEGIAGWVFAHGEPLLIPEVQADPRFSPRVDEITEFASRSVLAAPVKINDQTIAVIELVNPHRGSFEHKDLDLLTMITPHAGMAIENARLYEDLSRQNRGLLCLVRASQDLSASLDVEQIAQLVVHHLADLIPAARSGIILLDAEGNQAQLMAGWPGRQGQELKIGATLDLTLYPEIAHVIRARRPLHIPDVRTDSLLMPVRELIHPLGLSSLLVLPIQDQERVFGVVSLAHFDPAHHFTQNDIAIGRAFANQASIALQNAGLYGELVRKTVQLVEADRHKSEFVSHVSHEIRTPLNSVIGFSELLRDVLGDNLTDKQRKCVDNIHISGKHLLELINTILDLSKVEKGKLDLAMENFALVPTITEVLTIMRPLSDRKGVALELDVRDGPEELYADQSRFKQILYNLLSNAIKFTPNEGRVSVTVRAVASGAVESPGQEVENGGIVEVTIQDNGIGIRPEDHQRIFEAFEQVENPVSRQFEGTGLGLPLTKCLVELHGGRIWVESTPGRGSAFRFTLPREHRSPPSG